MPLMPQKLSQQVRPSVCGIVEMLVTKTKTNRKKIRTIPKAYEKKHKKIAQILQLHYRWSRPTKIVV